MKRLLLLLVWTLLPISVDAGVKFETYNAETDTVSLNLSTVAYAMITLHRIECDTCVSAWIRGGDYFEEIDAIVCDTVFRIQYEDVWAPKMQVWLDSLQWQKLLLLIGKE